MAFGRRGVVPYEGDGDKRRGGKAALYPLTPLPSDIALSTSPHSAPSTKSPNQSTKMTLAIALLNVQLSCLFIALSSLLPHHTASTTSEVSPVDQGVLDDTHEIYDPYTITNPPRQRQQQRPALESTFSSSFQQFPQPPPPRPASAASDHRPLRRVSPLGENNRPSSTAHRRVASVDAAFRPQRDRSYVQQPTNPVIGRRVRIAGVTSADIAPALSEAETEPGASIAGDSVTQLDESYWPSRSRRVSPRTASAIRWALEEAIRKPFPFTPVLEELNAPMSELVSSTGLGTGPQTRPQNGGSRPVQARPVHTQVPAGVRTPTDIMRDRRDREARKKAEKEAHDRELEVQEQTKQQIQQQYAAAAGAVAGEVPAQRRQPNVRQPAAVDPTIHPDQPTSYPPPSAAAARRAEAARAPATQRAPQMRPPPATSQQPAPAVAASSTYQQPHSQSQPQVRQPLPSQASQPAPGESQAPQNTSQAPAQDQLKRTTFPHAFERWETLSSHWEGLTGYWIRKLEQNNNELSQDPLNQQMARQINDLSAAGANLFHAVVELQRLRASSERRFQRWFFDTRSEQEKAREVQADLERQVAGLKLERDDVVELRQKADADRKRAEELVKEMRRELQISKEEARRAWEELGRREQEERDRTASLRNGEPTVVGGVQVLPMIAGMPSRQNSSANRPSTREGPYPSGPTASSMGGQPETHEQDPYNEEPSLTETDPFVETTQRPGQGYSTSTARPATSSSTVIGGTPTSQPPITTGAYDPSGRFYQHGGSALHNEPEPDARSYVASTEGSELEDYGTVTHPDYRHDPQHGYAGSEGYDDEEEEPYDPASYPPGTSAASSVHGYGQGNVDYSGSGWGGWDSITPRHRHPTRLSDVLEEEDERSRTSPSRASQASRGLH
uniref:Reticulocyte-binding protein 2 like a n=1 Tax=Talaromyces marneffei PM1 TaxID=1077442 RepID=A0A093VSP8_TALMA